MHEKILQESRQFRWNLYCRRQLWILYTKSEVTQNYEFSHIFQKAVECCQEFKCTLNLVDAKDAGRLLKINWPIHHSEKGKKKAIVRHERISDQVQDYFTVARPSFGCVDAAGGSSSDNWHWQPANL